MSTRPYPLTFGPLLLEKVWGGDRLARFGKAVAPGSRIGESWELADLDSTSASGAGGAAARSIIANGPLAGKTVHEAVEQWGAQSFGLRAGQPFPLLIKYLDARENLSVQVHPTPEFAALHPGAHVKTECWYVLDAEPGSVIYKGLRHGVSADEFARLARAGDPAIVECLQSVAAEAGECHKLVSGTVHALGAGVLVAEVQTPSDTTFRLYDWGRAGRQLHIEQALACAIMSPATGATWFASGPWSRLATLDRFILDEARPATGQTIPAADPGRSAVLMVLAGRGSLGPTASGEFEPLALHPGVTVLLPAAIATAAAVRGETPMIVLRATVV